MTAWRKSSHSANNGACVEVATMADVAIAVRDSTQPDGTVLILTPAAWRDLTARIRAADG